MACFLRITGGADDGDRVRFEEPIQAALFHGHSWWPPGEGTDGASLIRFACGFCDRLRITIGQCAGAQIKAQLP